MKVLCADQIRAADAHTIENEPIASIDLMERASKQLFHWLHQKFDTKTSFYIVCGPGNNGGDGLALARLLSNAGISVKCFCIESEKQSKDYQINFHRLQSICNATIIKSVQDMPEVSGSDVIVDAIFGSGLDRKIEGLYADIVRRINELESTVVSVDVPSGLFCAIENKDDVKVHAHYTLTFQVPKLSFFLPQNEHIVGEWEVLDIGLSTEFINSFEDAPDYVNQHFVDLDLFKLSKFSHKGTNGHALVIGGSTSKMGAITMTVAGALRSGAGLVTAMVPKCGRNIMLVTNPEAMILNSEDEDYISGNPNVDGFDAIGIGPGLDQNEMTESFLTQNISVLKNLVLDADALNILSSKKELLGQLPENSILTPHPGEFRRLVGDWDNDYEKIEMLKEFCKEHKIITVLKGAHSITCTSKGHLYFNATGNAGMGKGGSGDVLTGVITALLARGISPEEAAYTGVFLHGMAGDIAAASTSEFSMIATDIIDSIPIAVDYLLES